MSFEIKSVTQDDLSAVKQFLQPFMNSQQLLPRTLVDLKLLLRHGFKAESADGSIIGFCALEIYSIGIGRQLIEACVRRAKEEEILELLAISSSEPLFKACGFDYSLPNQKRAFFYQTQNDADSENNPASNIDNNENPQR